MKCTDCKEEGAYMRSVWNKYLCSKCHIERWSQKENKMEEIIDKLYLMDFHKSAYDMLSQSERITVHEYRNFVDFDLIPFIRKYIEKNVKDIK